jgi:transglutaminase/protease-like cytokinesis protein 3
MSKEFYSIIINIGASKKSTTGYRQYLIYKNTITNNIDINTIQTRAINIQFGIGSTVLIRSVIVKTPFSQVNFYIIKVDTLFLLSLIDIDRL